MATHSSTPVWKIPWMEEPGRLQSMVSLRVRHDWVTSLSLWSFNWKGIINLWSTVRKWTRNNIWFNNWYRLSIHNCTVTIDIYDIHNLIYCVLNIWLHIHKEISYSLIELWKCVIFVMFLQYKDFFMFNKIIFAWCPIVLLHICSQSALSLWHVPCALEPWWHQSQMLCYHLWSSQMLCYHMWLSWGWIAWSFSW